MKNTKKLPNPILASNKKKIKVNLIGGFLGSGKTTLLRYFLSQPKLDEKVAVLVNELGEVGIDGQILRKPGLVLQELTNGCLCCQITGDMIQAIENIRDEYHPDRLLIESTGIAEPGKVLQVLYYAEPLARSLRVEPTIVVVDAKSFENLYAAVSYHYVMQIKSADLILLNKIDLVDSRKLNGIEKKIKELNSQAFLVRTKHCQVNLLQLLEGHPAARAVRNSPSSARFVKDGPPQKDKEETFSSFVYKSMALYDPALLKQCFSKDLLRDCFRIKGFVRLPGGIHLLNYVSHQFELEPFETVKKQGGKREATELVFIGRKMNEKKIFHQLKRCEII